MTLMTLTEFLLERFAEDEAGATPGEGWDVSNWDWDVSVQFWDYGEVHIGHQRFLADCEAKRAIMKEHDGAHNCVRYVDPDDNRDCRTLRALATVYANHPDFDEAWRL
jgi:hypothetical protein